MTEEARSRGELGRSAPVRGWRAAFPPAQWLPTYRPQWLANDAVAGVTLAAYAIPVSLAYASLAGLPPQYGIYCYLVGDLFYALFGTSRQLAIRPTSAISMLVGVTVCLPSFMERYSEVPILMLGLNILIRPRLKNYLG